MKYCPKCQRKYDEDILRFCMKDGTPLVDEEEPNFIQMPSESLPDEDQDDPSEVTIVRRNKPAPVPSPPMPPPAEELSGHSRSGETSGGQRIVVPTTEQQQRDRTAAAAYTAPPQKPNTAKIVVATIFLTLLVLALGGLGFWAIQSLVMSGDTNTNVNVNANFGNEDTNVNTNIEDANFDFNVNSAFDSNSNTNVETPTPTPSPTQTPSPSPTQTPRPSPSETPTPDSDEDENDDDVRTPTPTPRRTPNRTPTPLIIRPDPSPTSSGMLNGRAVSLPKPVYPDTAKRMRVSGRVTVRVAVDRDGNITSARAVDDPTLLRSAAENAARRAKMPRNRTATSGTLVYNFTNN